MSDLRRFSVLDLGLLTLTLAAAAGSRAWFLKTYADGPNGAPLPAQVERSQGEGSPDELHELIRNLTEGRGFVARAPLAAGVEPTADQAPGYPWLLSLLARLHADPNGLDNTTRWLQCLLGTLTAGLYFLFARRAFQSRLVATLAGLFTAVHPYWIINTGEVADGVLCSFLLATVLCIGARASYAGGPLASLVLGLALAALALVRAALLPFALVGLLGFLWRCRGMARGWMCAFLACLGFVNGLAPWTLRNFRELGAFVPVADSTYLHLWMGNNAASTGGSESDSAVVNSLAELRSEERDALAERLAQMPQVERYGQFAPALAKMIRTDPGGTARRRIDAAVAFFIGEGWNKQQRALRTGAAQNLPSPQGEGWSFALPLALLLMLVLAALGWRWSYGWRDGAWLASLAAVWIPLPYILSHAEWLHGPRLPLDGVLLCYAAFAVACMAPNVAGRLLSGSAPNP